MFDATKEFWEINREERAFVALLAHLVLASHAARADVVSVINQSLPSRPLLDPDHLQVYVEPAPLRDYWRALGPYLIAAGSTHEARRAVLETILDELSLAHEMINELSFFWTGKLPGAGKLWSPGHWSGDGIAASGLDISAQSALRTVKQAWNSKPDLMLVTSGSAVLVEAKLESGFGVGQLQNARRIAELLHLLCAERFRPRPANLTLTLAGQPKIGDYLDGSIRWRDVLNDVVLEAADPFSRKALGRLRAAYSHY